MIENKIIFSFIKRKFLNQKMSDPEISPSKIVYTFSVNYSYEDNYCDKKFVYNTILGTLCAAEAFFNELKQKILEGIDEIFVDSSENVFINKLKKILNKLRECLSNRESFYSGGFCCNFVKNGDESFFIQVYMDNSSFFNVKVNSVEFRQSE